MKSIFIGSALLLTSLSTYATETLTVTSDSIPTCYERSNTAILTAIKNAEEKIDTQICLGPDLIKLISKIEESGPTTCGSATVVATYSCN
jgi:hypothetical protein